MMVPRFFVLPGVMLTATATYIAFASGGGSIGQGSAIPTATVEHSRLIAPTSTPNPRRSPVPIPPGLSGKLTYRTGHDEVTVQFPDVREVAQGPSRGAYAMASADGLWTVDNDCTTGNGSRACTLKLVSQDGATRDLKADVDLQWSRAVQWSPAGHQLAILERNDSGSRIVILNDLYALPDDPSAQVIGDGARNISAFAWTNDITRADGRTVSSLIAARGDSTLNALVQIDADTGEVRPLVKLNQMPNYLYASPDHSMFAFTGDRDDGWHLFLSDNRQPGEIRDLGPMGSDGPSGKPVPQSVPDVKTPMYIAWSPDGRTLAFGGGLDPPYVMTIIDVGTGAVRRTEFPDGYPGEIKWSPDGTMIAVSAYNIPRTHHESYVVDPASGDARDVLSGCVIVWSPDSRFLAIHGEKEPGIAIADARTLEHVQLTHTVGDTPVEWSP